MSIVLNGHTYDASQFYGYGYLQTFPATGQTIFPNSIFADMLAELAAASAILTGGISPSTSGNIIVSNGTLWTRSRDGTVDVVLGGHLLALSDNTKDIGASGASRFRDLFLSRNATFGSSVTVSDGIAVINRTAGASNAAYLAFQIGAVTKALFGAEGGAGNLVVGSAVGEAIVRAVNANILFSSDSGGNIAAKVTPAGFFQVVTAGGFAIGPISSVPRIAYAAGIFNFLTAGNGDATLQTGHMQAETDNTFDIGTSGALRFRDMFLSRSILAGGTIYTVRNTQTTSSTTGDIVLPGANAYRFGHPTTGTNATYTYAQLVGGTNVSFGDQAWESDIQAASRIQFKTPSGTPLTVSGSSNGSGRITSTSVGSLANNGTLDLVMNPNGGMVVGILVVSNSDVTNAGNATRTVYAVTGRGTTFTYSVISTTNGATAAWAFTLSTPSADTVRLTNNGGAAANSYIAYFGLDGG